MFGAIGGSKMPQKYPYKIHLSRGTFYTVLFPAVSNDAYYSYLVPVDWYWYQISDTGTGQTKARNQECFENLKT